MSGRKNCSTRFWVLTPTPSRLLFEETQRILNLIVTKQNPKHDIIVPEYPSGISKFKNGFYNVYKLQ